MTQQNQQNSGRQVLWVLLRVSQANLSKIQPGKIKAWKAREIKPPDTAGLRLELYPLLKKVHTVLYAAGTRRHLAGSNFNDQCSGNMVLYFEMKSDLKAIYGV